MNTVTIYKSSKVASLPMNELDRLHDFAEDMAYERDVNISFGSNKVRMDSCGFTKEFDYPANISAFSVENCLSEWVEEFDYELDNFMASLDDEEEEEVTIPDLLPWAPWMGIDGDELVTCAEDMGIGW